TNSDKILTSEYLDWYARLTGLPSILTDKIRSKLYKRYKKETGLDPWINSKTKISVSNKTREAEPCYSRNSPISRTNLNKMECLYKYAIEHGEDPEKFSIVTETEKNRWAIRCFRGDLERDIRFYQGALERKEDPRKYHKFLTDRDRLIGEELLRHNILKSGSNTTWLDNLMEEWGKNHTQFIQIFSQA
ncbi:4168_t:CDS:1, partial [Entrophospora sp. SA101]